MVISCREQLKEEENMKLPQPAVTGENGSRLPEWQRNAVIYEVNLRHYTPEGTFKAFESHIPRLKEMGVSILWFMPIHPISLKNRKGELGSPFAVADYLSVNPDFGSIADFRHMVDAVHDAGMYVIIDWVANHTGWDHSWITQHPEWYTKDQEGNITEPINIETGEPWGWTDVADLDYGNREMKRAMINALAFWVKEGGVDGYRMDVAHGVPADFWEECADSLYAIRPLFLLAEAEIPAIVNNGAFVMDYGWKMIELLNGIASSRMRGEERGKKLVKGNIIKGGPEVSGEFTAQDIDRQLEKQEQVYERGYKMYFTSNHDENAWAGTEFQRFGAGHKAFAVLTATFDGMPLLYSGQESAVDRQFVFFSKDEIDWGDFQYAGFYKTLFCLKHRNRALWNGKYGGRLQKIPTGSDEAVYAFIREKEGDKAVVLINLSSEKQPIALKGDKFAGSYTNVFDQNATRLTANMKMQLNPWEYLVLSNK
jgi:glycosidase